MRGGKKWMRTSGGKVSGLRRSNAQPHDHLHHQAMIKCKPLPPKEVLDYWFRLEPETGRLFWKEKPCRRIHAGAEAGNCTNLVSGKRWINKVPGYSGSFYRYRLVWKMVYGCDPSDALDHWDKNTLNDSPTNLLDGGKSWNGRNKTVVAKSGYRGVVERKNKKGSKWWVSLTEMGKNVYVGTFDTPEEAAAAYEKARLARKPSQSATV